MFENVFKLLKIKKNIFTFLTQGGVHNSLSRIEPPALRLGHVDLH